MIDETLAQSAWTAVRGFYPALDPSADVWAREVDGAVELVVAEPLAALVGPPSAPETHARYVVRVTDGEEEIVDEARVAPEDWEGRGFRRVRAELGAMELLAAIESHLAFAAAPGPATPQLAERLEDLLTRARSALERGELAVGFPDAEAAAEWLQDAEARAAALQT